MTFSQKTFALLVLLAILNTASSGVYAADHGEVKKLGALSTVGQRESQKNVWIIGRQTGQVSIKIDKGESFASSTVPENWVLEGGTVSPAYIYTVRLGLKIRLTQPVKQPNALEPDVCIYHDGQYWQVERRSLKPIFECCDDSKRAEIKGQSVLLDGRELLKLSQSGVPGTWYDTADLDVTLSEGFHDKLVLDLSNSCEGTLDSWRGKELLLRLDNTAKVSMDRLSADQTYIRQAHQSTAKINSLTCGKLDAYVRDNSILIIPQGHIESASITELAGGRATISAQINKQDKSSIGIPNSQPLTRKPGPKGPSIQFPSHGDFVIRDPGSS
ncbi:MAG TPA: hypothetical protein V6C86_00250 [Oculatellaceae cyanobacterium]